MIRLVALMLFLLQAASALALGLESPLPSQQQEQQAVALFRTIRCVVCAGESIADSPAQIAADMRRSIRAQIANGVSDADITAGLVGHYGDSVLMRPPLNAATWPLWFGPLLIAVAALLFARRFFRKTTS